MRGFPAALKPPCMLVLNYMASYLEFTDVYLICFIISQHHIIYIWYTYSMNICVHSMISCGTEILILVGPDASERTRGALARVGSCVAVDRGSTHAIGIVYTF